MAQNAAEEIHNAMRVRKTKVRPSELELVAALDTAGYLTIDRVQAVTSITRSRWYHGMRAGKYPQPVKLGYMSFWKKEEVLKCGDQMQKTGLLGII